MTTVTHDVAVIGAGVFGAWITLELRRSGRSVILLDAYGAANSRASSGGESRIIRMGYGRDEIYTRWALRSLERWKEFSNRVGERLFEQTGVLWFGRGDDPHVARTEPLLRSLGIGLRRLTRAELGSEYPQLTPDTADWALLEPESGVLLARQAVRAVVREAEKLGAAFRQVAVTSPSGRGHLEAVVTTSQERILAEQFVFACGPWLPRLFPNVVGDRIHPTRQEVFFFGPPAGDGRFAPPLMPAWIDFGEGAYGVPDLEHRGVKLAFDYHGPSFDPDTGDRQITPSMLAQIRSLLARRIPALANAPLVETRVCQYENTSSGDFLIDRHPDFANVWLVGGGSGHGFKHGPAVAEYLVGRVEDGAAVEHRFSLATKETVRRRQVY